MTTKTGTRLRQGDIVLVPVPFTDLSSQKRRPVIIIANDDYIRRSEDVIVVAMTSNPDAGPYAFTITSSDLESGALNRPGQIRVDKIYTLAQSIVVRVFGRVDASVLSQIRDQLLTLTSSTP